MPINRTLWGALWERAAREEIGIYIAFADLSNAKHQLRLSRPPGFEDYTVATTPLPNVLFIVRPGVTINDESEANAARQIYSDLE